jgi:hypothetical protein
MHNVAQNLEAEFNEADLLPKTKEVAIMAIAAYIAVNAANDVEHMRLCGIWRSKELGCFKAQLTKGAK